MPLLYALSILAALLPVLLYVSHIIAVPYSNIMLAFGIACCSGIFTKNRKIFLSTFSVPLLFLCTYIYAQWDTDVVIGSSLVCSSTFFLTLIIFKNRIQKNIQTVISHHLVSSYYFTLSGMILCASLSMITDDLTHEHVIVNSIYTVFLACTIVSVVAAICFSIFPKRLKAVTFIIAALLGMWLCNRLGVIIAPVGTWLVYVTSHIPSNLLVETFNLPPLLPQVVEANLVHFMHMFNTQATFVHPNFIKPFFVMEPCIIMGFAGMFLALEYMVHAYAAASLRTHSPSVYFSTSTICMQGFVALCSSALVGVPLTLSVENNALHRIIQYREEKAIFIAGLLSIAVAFLGKPLWFLYAVRFPVLGVQGALVAGYVIFLGMLFFPNRSRPVDVVSTLPMVLTTLLFPTYFMFAELPFPPLWILLSMAMIYNFVSRSQK